MDWSWLVCFNLCGAWFIFLVVEVLERWFLASALSSKKKKKNPTKRSPSFRCVGWDSATLPVLRQRWVFPCIFYIVLICCLSGFLGELTLRLKCRWLVRIVTFQLYYASGEKKAEPAYRFIWLFKRCCWGRMVGVCAGRSGVSLQKSGNPFGGWGLTLLLLETERKPKWLYGWRSRS